MTESPPGFAIVMGRLSDIERAVGRLEFALWVLIVLLVCFLFVYLRRSRAAGADSIPDLNEKFTSAYERGDFEDALNMLEVRALETPADARIPYWQGCCYFRLRQWDKAVEKFEAAVMLEPPYRKSVKDYMEFIELNELVPGVSGYVDRRRDD